MQKIREACFCDCHGTKKLDSSLNCEVLKKENSPECDDGNKFKSSQERKKIKIEFEETDTTVTTTSTIQTSSTTTSTFISNADTSDRMINIRYDPKLMSMDCEGGDSTFNKTETSKAECPCVIYFL